MVDRSHQGNGFSWKTPKMEFSAHTDVVLKKSCRKILMLHKVRLLEKWFRPFAAVTTGNEFDL